MMYVAKCPLRVSLVGGSTDQEAFIAKYGRGAVISFPSNLFAYISVHGNNRGKYIINYSRKEEVETLDEIKNDVARVCLQHFSSSGPVTVTFNADIHGTGSGLASSTAYTIALIKALSLYCGETYTEYDICELAIRLERKFNPLTGYQDAYGCGIGGFKRIDFAKSGQPSFTFLSSKFISSNFKMGLYHTGTSRSSTNVLSSLDFDKSLPLLYKVDCMHEAFQATDKERFLEIFREGWEAKKKVSSLILEHQPLLLLDAAMQQNNTILGVKLCGAGGGGYFLAFGKSDLPIINGIIPIPIGISEAGVVGAQV